LNPMVGEPYHQTLQSTGGTLPVTWSVPPGTLPAGFTLDPSTGTIAGTATASEVGTTNFTAQLTDSSSPTPLTATQPLSLTITTATACGTGSESLLNGQYAMSLTGFDASGPVGMLATFTSDGTGKITAGVEDINSAASGGLQTNVPVTAASSSYSVGPDRRGCLTLVTSLGTRVFRFSLGIINTGVAADGRAIEFDSTGTNTTGSFDLQTPAAFSNAAVTGDFAFTAHSALTAAAGGGFLAAAGVLNLSGTAVTGSGDININGSVDPGNTGYPATAMTFTPGTYNIGPNGRGTLSFAVPTSPTPTTINAIIYVLNTTQMYLMSSDPQSSTSSLFSGFAGQQTGRPYTNASLSQSAVLFAAGQTAGTGNASRVEAGVFAPDGSGNFTFAGDQNSGGTTSTPTAAGTFTVVSNGRVLVMNSGSTTPALILYMVLPNWAYVLSTDNHVMIGYTEPQSGGPFTNTSLSGTFEFGTILPVVAANPLTAGVATYDGIGNVTATFDINENGFLSLGNVVTGTYAASSSGRVLTPASGATRRVTYIADPTTVFSLGYASTDANPTLLLMNQ
jgi:hypothetical protein